MKKIILLFTFLSSAYLAFAQTGKIRGTVFEAATGEPLIGVTVVIKGTTQGAIADLDGKFEIRTTPGIYDVQASFVSFATVTISGVEVKSGEVTLLDNIMLREDVQQLESVVISAEAIRDSEAALMTVKQKSVTVMDGISASSFRKIGDSDAADAIKRVTGVSVEGGKYVFVRGLGDRYTKTTLNNVDVPGLDPDRNSLQIDIFPTNLINNLIVKKSASADISADFTGGLVNIETKDFPDEKIFSVSASIGYNPSMHFNSNYINYEGSSTDFMGFDNGRRDLPPNARGNEIPNPAGDYTDEEINTFLKGYDPVLGAKKQNSFMDYSLGISLGNQFSMKNDNKLGYILSLSYKNETKFYDDQLYGEYQTAIDKNEYELVPALVREGIQGENNVLLGGLFGVAYKTQFSKYKLNFMHLQNGETKAGQFSIFDNDDAVGKSGYMGSSDILEYSERSLTNILLAGSHYNADNTWLIEWKLAPTKSKITDPDIRKTAFTFTTADTLFAPGAAGNPIRTWRYLDEVNYVGKLDVTKEFNLWGAPAKLKFGGSYVYKERDYEILTYDLQFFGSQPDFGYNPNNVLIDENLWPNGSLYYSTGNKDNNPNAYNSNVNNASGFISSELSPLTKLKLILGLRVENYVQRYTGYDLFGTFYDNEIVLDPLDLFPSANAIYSLTETQNLRFSYSKTTARPSFKEASYVTIQDVISNRTFIGGFVPVGNWDGNLHETGIENFDLRWEYFLKRGQLFSVSAFYKTFDDPIEMVRLSGNFTTVENQPRNVGFGQIYGAEFEIRKSFDFISPRLSGFSFSSNVTITKSTIKMNDAEYTARKGEERVGEEISDERDMAGQAPYIINAGFSFQDPDTGFDAGLFYNVQGKTLIIVGNGRYSDIYSQPFNSLNFNLNKSFGAEKKSTVSFKVTNILNDVREEAYSSYQAQDQYYERYSPGTSFSVGLKYAF